MWWATEDGNESRVRRDIAHMSEKSGDFSPRVLALGGVRVDGELRPLVLFRDSLLVRPNSDAGSLTSDIFRQTVPPPRLVTPLELRSASSFFYSMQDVEALSLPRLREELYRFAPPQNTLFVLMSEPQPALGLDHAPGVRLGRGGRGTLGVGFEVGSDQFFSSAGHVFGGALGAAWSAATQPADVLLRIRRLGLFTMESLFGSLASFGDPLMHQSVADIAIILPHHRVPTSAATPVTAPAADLEPCTMYGAESGTRLGWKAGALSAGSIPLRWPKSWFVMTATSVGFATQGDSGARVHDSKGRILGHVVGTSGVRTRDGTAQAAIVQDIGFQRSYAEQSLGMPAGSALVVAS